MSRSVPLKTSVDVLRLRRPAAVLERLFLQLERIIRPGMSTLQLDGICKRLLEKNAEVRQIGYPTFPGSVCTSVNNVAAHGVPGSYVLESGDMITVDATIDIQGWKGDAAWTYVVGTPDTDQMRLLRAAWRATFAGIAACHAGARLGDVGYAIREAARKMGCAVITDFTGHGIGHQLHENPAVPNSGEPGTGEPIVPGMVLNIEPVVTLGSGEVVKLPDNWSYVTRDGANAAQYEHTVAVFRDRVELLTFSRTGRDLTVDLPPYY